MLTVACAETGDYRGRGAEYVAKLRAMVARNLAAPHRFVVLTDAPERHPGVEAVKLSGGLPGWWNKLELFRPGRFEGRVLYLDLDSVITGPLERLLAHRGLVHLQSWGWKRNDYLSAVMVWDGDEHAEAWTAFDADVPHIYRGDQDYLTAVGGWEALPEGLVCSYRYHARERVPEGCVVVQFHGEPKPAEAGGWVPAAWG